MLEAKSITKSFRSYVKQPGIRGSLRSLISRTYNLKTAVNLFDLSIETGEIVGLLGPNGAGKTTLMKMFTGIVVPSSGTISIAGHVPFEREKAFRQKIALVMGQKSQLWWDIPAMDSLLLLQRYYEIDNHRFRKRVALMGEMLNVTALFNTHVRKLSLGERMKLELLASLLHSPEVIFLDEPTIGLDLIAQENIRTFIMDYHRDNNSTIILTSHYMADVQALCKRLVLIFNGEKGYDGSIEKFEHLLGHKKSVSFSFAHEIDPTDQFFTPFDPLWIGLREVELKLSDDELGPVSAKILSDYSVRDFHTEKLPIEKVMKAVMERPELLRGQH